MVLEKSAKSIKDDIHFVRKASLTYPFIVFEVQPSIILQDKLLFQDLTQLFLHNTKFLRLFEQDMEKSLLIEVVRKKGRYLKFLTASKDNRDIVLEAVKNDWFAIHFMNIEFRNDREIMQIAIQQSPIKASKYLPKTIVLTEENG